MYILVTRTEEVSGKDGFKRQTVGDLDVFDFKGGNKIYSCKTLELQWFKNLPKVSCIPTGEYPFQVLNSSPSFAYQHLWIKNVPNRKWIKVHIGNSYKEIEGCILVGTHYGYLPDDDVIDILGSRNAMNSLNKAIGDVKHGMIEIVSNVDYKNRREFWEVATEKIQLPPQDLTV